MRATWWFRTAVLMGVVSGCGGGSPDRTAADGQACTSPAGCDGGQVSSAEDPAQAEELAKHPLCPGGVIESSYAIGRVSDATAIADCTTIRGSLFIKTDATTTEISLPALQSVRELEVHETDLESLSLPALHTVTQRGVAIYTNSKLERVELPALASVQGRFVFEGNRFVIELSLPKLVEADSFLISSNYVLETVSAPRLETARELHLTSDAALTQVDLSSLARAPVGILIYKLAALETLVLPALQSAGTVTVYENPHLTTLGFPELTVGASRGGASSGFSVYDHPQLATLVLSKLATVDGGMSVSSNGLLAELSLPALTRSGTFVVHENVELTVLSAPTLVQLQSRLRITGNPKLPAEQAEAVSRQLVDFAGVTQIGGNG